MKQLTKSEDKMCVILLTIKKVVVIKARERKQQCFSVLCLCEVQSDGLSKKITHNEYILVLFVLLLSYNNVTFSG